MSDEVALVDVGTLGDVQLGDGAGVAGHDVGLVGGLHRAAGLTDVGAVVFVLHTTRKRMRAAVRRMSA